MKKMVKGTVVVMAMALLLPWAARAQQAGGIELTTVAEKEAVKTDAQGKKEVTLTDATKGNVLPGDIVRFTLYYENKGDKPATDVVLQNPVPEHMVYVDGSAEGKGARLAFSIDNGKTFAAPDKLMVKIAGGKERPAAAADYTAVRWTLEQAVAKGAKGSVSFRARVK